MNFESNKALKNISKAILISAALINPLQTDNGGNHQNYLSIWSATALTAFFLILVFFATASTAASLAIFLIFFQALTCILTFFSQEKKRDGACREGGNGDRGEKDSMVLSFKWIIHGMLIKIGPHGTLNTNKELALLFT